VEWLLVRAVLNETQFLTFTGCRKVLGHIFILPFQETGNILNFCEVGLKISGVAPISSQAAIHFPNTSLASVSMAATERHTVAFVGTADGKLKKVSYCIQLSNTFQRVVAEIALWLLTDFPQLLITVFCNLTERDVFFLLARI